MTEHFVRAPEWTWYILFYFFLGGLSGGSYAIATLLRRRSLADEPAARIGYYVAFSCWRLAVISEGVYNRYLHGAMGEQEGVDTTSMAAGVELLANRALVALEKLG